MAKMFTREMYDELVEVLSSEAVVVFDAQDPEQVGARSSVNHPWQVETSELSPEVLLPDALGDSGLADVRDRGAARGLGRCRRGRLLPLRQGERPAGDRRST